MIWCDDVSSEGLWPAAVMMVWFCITYVAVPSLLVTFNSADDEEAGADSPTSMSSNSSARLGTEPMSCGTGLICCGFPELGRGASGKRGAGGGVAKLPGAEGGWEGDND